MRIYSKISTEMVLIKRETGIKPDESTPKCQVWNAWKLNYLCRVYDKYGILSISFWMYLYGKKVLINISCNNKVFIQKENPLAFLTKNIIAFGNSQFREYTFRFSNLILKIKPSVTVRLQNDWFERFCSLKVMQSNF